MSHVTKGHAMKLTILTETHSLVLLGIAATLGIVIVTMLLTFFLADFRPTTIEEHKVTIHINKADLYVDTRGRWILQFEERKADLKPADMP